MELKVENFLKISNPRKELPHISDSIELKRDEKYGRMIVAKENLKPGDVIAIEEPFLLSLDKSDADQISCALCLKKICNAFTCMGCKSIKFCSKNCQNDNWELYHKYECENFHEIDSEDSFLLMMNRMLFKSISVCGSLQNLNKILDLIDQSLNILDLDFNSDLEKMLACCYNLECGNFSEDFLFIDSFAKSPFLKQFYDSTRDGKNKDEEILKKTVLRILGILNRNSFAINTKSHRAGALYIFGCLINHSCSPNLDKINVGSKAVFICNRPILKSEQLFLCYRRPFYYDSIYNRRISLYRQFNFHCECEACNDEEFLQFVNSFKKFREEVKTYEEYKKNCNFITGNISSYPCFEIIQAIYSNKKFLQNFLNEY